MNRGAMISPPSARQMRASQRDLGRAARLPELFEVECASVRFLSAFSEGGRKARKLIDGNHR